MASVTIEVDLPPGVEITGYERHQDGHGFEVRWPLPERGCPQRCGHEDTAHIEFQTTPQVIRDLNVWDQPSFWVYQAPFHRCARCDHRQHIIPPFKRKDVAYTYRFEPFVLRSLIGSNAEEVARRLGISAEMVEDADPELLGCASDQCGGGGNQSQGAGDYFYCLSILTTIKLCCDIVLRHGSWWCPAN